MDMGCCYSEFHALCDRQTTIYISDPENPFIGAINNNVGSLFSPVLIFRSIALKS